MFGSSVAIFGDTIVIGAYGESSNATGVNGNQANNSAFSAGAAYVFAREGTSWIQQAYLKASNTGAGDNFGWSVAVSGDTIVVGAKDEASNATGINGDQNNDSVAGAGAAYVFVRDGTNWAQQAYLKASNPDTNDWFGWSVAISGDTVVVGAPFEDSLAIGVNGDPSDNTFTDSGAAYVFVRSGTNWSQQVYLKASNTGYWDNFGGAVAVSGDTVLVGAASEPSNATGINGDQNDNTALGAGAAYVFVRDGTNWSQQAYLKASNNAAVFGGFKFGGAVSLWNHTAVVGAIGEGSEAGAAYVFVRDGTNWIQTAYLKASNTEPLDRFGQSVGVSEYFVIVGAKSEKSSAMGVNGNQCDNSALEAGAAYVFNRNAPSSGSPEISVTVSGNELINGSATVDIGGVRAGASADAFLRIWNIGGAELTGEVTVTGADAGYFTGSSSFGPMPFQCGNSLALRVRFTPTGFGTKTAVLHIFSNDSDESPFDVTLTGTGLPPHEVAQQAYAKASNTGAADGFGTAVGLSGDTMVVGAPFEDSNATGVNGSETNNSAASAGAVYVFVREGTNWVQQAYLKASNTGPNDQFGCSLAISGNTLAVGAPFEASNATGVNGDQSNNSAGAAGAAYVFVREGTNWTQQAYVKPSLTRAGMRFGESISISGDTLTVGASFESSKATGVNGNPNPSNNVAQYSGAAYVFVREGTNWTQQAYVKASNTGDGDRFGFALSVSGDMLVVGAPFEDSNATGVNGNQTNNAAGTAGAAYIFARKGTNWSQEAYLKSAYTRPNDHFGEAVGASGNTVVIGVSFDDGNARGVNSSPTNFSADDSGAAFIFVREGTNWSQQAYLKASDPFYDVFGNALRLSYNAFGYAVALSGDTLVVGAPGEDSNAKGVNGNQTSTSVNDPGAVYVGAAYVFVRSGTTWAQQVYLKASNTGFDDWFGYALAVDGNTVIVSAPNEDSNTTGVNGNQTNNSASESGAAYVFTGVGSRHRLILLPESSTSFLIRFDGVPTFSYRLERAPNLTGPWESIATNTAPASGYVEIRDPSPIPGQAFYRSVHP